MGLLDRFFGKPTLESFAAALIKAIREAGGPDEFRYDAARQIVLQVRDGKEVGQVNPANMFRTYVEAPKHERPNLMVRFVRVVLSTHREPPEDYEAARTDLRPRLWTRATLEFQGIAGQTPSLVSVPVGGHLQVCLAYDWPDSVQTVPPDWLEKWGVTAYQAMEDAVENLSEATEGYAAFESNLYSFVTGDSYDASRIMLIDRITAMEVKGRHVAMAPKRDTLVVTGDEDEEGLRMMADIAEPALGESYPLVGVPMVLEDGEWIDWMPPEGHPLRRRFGEIRTRWLGSNYEEQKGMMDAHHEKTGEDVYIASFGLVKRASDDALISYCVWSEGVHSLLPETDKVVLLRNGETAALGDWERVARAVGGLLEATDDYPARYRTLGFPDEAAIKAIGAGEL